MMSKILWLSFLIIIVFSYPSICFSEMKTVEHETCDQYQGDLKNKKKLKDFRQLLRKITIVEGILSSDESIKNEISISDDFMTKLSKYPEKVTIISHTEKGKEICDKLKITFDQEVVRKYISQMETVR